MIIFLDGTYGTGKTTAASIIMKNINGIKLEFIESDFWFHKMCNHITCKARENDSTPNFGGMFPQDNIKFLKFFQKKISGKIKRSDKQLLVDMALTTIECKELILDYFMETHQKVLHIILMAGEEVIKDRIIHDADRDKPQALYAVKRNLDFLNKNYSDAYQINTENKEAGEVADEIMGIIAFHTAEAPISDLLYTFYAI